jgi:hypothetical protein
MLDRSLTVNRIRLILSSMYKWQCSADTLSFHGAEFDIEKNDTLLPHAQPPTWKTRDCTSSGSYPLSCLAWMALSEAYAPASKALRVIRA